jgi:hypothetical protein
MIPLTYHIGENKTLGAARNVNVANIIKGWLETSVTILKYEAGLK